MNKATEYELIANAQAGCDDSKNDLYEHWKRLIYKQVLNFSNGSHDCEFDEYLSFAHEGFLKAINKFDFSKGCRFSTLLHPCIYKALCKQYRNNKEKVKRHGISMAEYCDDQLEVQDFRSLSPPDELMSKESVLIARKAISELDERKRFVIESRMDGRKLREVGEDLKVTKERVRQIEKSAEKSLLEFIENEEKVKDTVFENKAESLTVVRENAPATPSTLEQLLVDSINGVISGKITPQQANSVSALAGQLIKLRVVASVTPGGATLEGGSSPINHIS